MKTIQSVILLLALSLFSWSCSNKSDKEVETTTKGNIKIGVDKTVQPVMEQELKVWDSMYPEGHIATDYLAENELFRKFFQDSFRLIIATRDLTKEEKKAGADRKISYSSLAVARGGVAVIINNAAQDSVMTIGMLANILQDKFPRKYNVVFDQEGSSIVRQISDTVLHGAPFTKNVYAAGSDQKVIEYVEKNKNAIGLVGLSQIFDMNSTDPAGEFIHSVKIVAIYNDSMNKAYKPYPALVAYQYYPLSRNIYFITGETSYGLGTGFANFLSQPQGQLIFKKLMLVPLRTELQIRDAQVK